MIWGGSVASPTDIVLVPARQSWGPTERVLGALGLVVSLGLSLLAVRSFFLGAPIAAGFAHVLGAALFSMVLPALLPARSVEPRALGRVALLVFALFLPFVGMVGLGLALTLALYGRRPEHRDPLVYVRPPELPLQPLFMGEGAPLRFSEGALALVLRNAPNPDKRVAAVMAIRRLTQARATPLLRIALRDPEDDVRLLAYALTDSIDKELNRRIQLRLAQLRTAPFATQVHLRKALAQDYWDIAFLGLASVDVESHVLSEASKHLERVLELKPDGGAAFLLGRIRLRQRRPVEAEVSFARARALGIPSVAVGPYRAEAAFHLRRLADLRARLRELPATSRARQPLAEVIHFWLGAPETQDER